ncbi:nibrin-like [Homarus americanus]|uniref:nibrin-like n=1 Tax=Homarus americanus TaxID=6706 RepID=UPI001C478885|nr:nibrin-like [Homarus americanus]
MWTLEGNAALPNKVHYLHCGSTLLVSRKEGHIYLQGDISISRQHASIFIMHPPTNLKNMQALPKVMLNDLGAKYGSFVNDGIQRDEKLPDRATTELVNGDTVRFGMFNSSWRLVYRPLVVTTSTLRPESKPALAEALLKLGGHLIGEWKDACSYLVMNAVTLTVKVVCCLAAGGHIVTPEFFTEWLEAVVKKAPHPNPGDFQPPLQERSIRSAKVSLAPNNERKSLLRGRTFLFYSTRQLERMRQVIVLSGGSAEELNEVNYKMVTSSSYVLVEPPMKTPGSSQNITTYTTARKLVEDNGLRVVPESDIGLAILYVTATGHCNPAFKVSSILQSTTSSTSQFTEGLKIYATETQANENSISLTGTRVVAESGKSPASRQIKSTLPTSTLPPVLSGSSTSTNASMLTMLDQPLTAKTVNDDKENLHNTSRKRARPVSEQTGGPLTKRTSKLSLTQKHQDPPSPTQPIESQINGDEIQPDSVLPTSEFRPHHFSTEKDETLAPVTSTPDARRGQLNGSDTRAAITSKPTTTINNLDPSVDYTIRQSVPFVPFTLPSLKVETLDPDEVLTQSFSDDKQEPPSGKVDDCVMDVTDCRAGKRNAVNDGDTSLWKGGKKKRIENVNDGPIKTERISGNVSIVGHLNQRNQDSVCNVKWELADKDPFALPTSNTRRRSGGQSAVVGDKTSRMTVKKPSSDADLFALPTSSRSQRRRRMLEQKVELAGVPRESGRIEPEQTPVAQSNNARETDENQCQNSRIVTSQGNFISKKGCSIKRSPSELEAAAQTGVPPQEKATHGDVAELDIKMEKSLVIVEVASLVKRPSVNNTTNAQTLQNQSLGGLVNYKRFRKNTGDITSLPKILGGRDLVAHDLVRNRLRDAWFMENEDVTRMLDERDAFNRRQSGDENLFDLPMNPRNQRRRMIK